MHYDWNKRPTSPRLPNPPTPLATPTHRMRPLQHPTPRSPRQTPVDPQWTSAQSGGRQGKAGRTVAVGEREGTGTETAEETRLRELVWAAISSADRVVKAVLPVGLAEVDHHCSAYLLNK